MASYYFFHCGSGRGVQDASLGSAHEMPRCLDGQGQWVYVELEPVPDVAQQLQLIGVDAETIATVFTVGFSLYAGFWAMGWAAKGGIDAIRRL